MRLRPIYRRRQVPFARIDMLRATFVAFEEEVICSL